MFNNRNMRSVNESRDLTARARIRNAAVGLFGRQGIAATSVRAIAEESGVSPGLVIHHFGTKDGLRKACDAYVIELFGTGMTEGVGDSVSGGGDTNDEGRNRAAFESLTIEAVQSALAETDTYGPALDYLRRMLTEDASMAEQIFDGFMTTTLEGLQAQSVAGMIRPQEDLEATAALLVVFGLAPFVLEAPFAKVLGREHIDGELLRRITLPTLEMFTHGLYADDSILKALRDGEEK